MSAWWLRRLFDRFLPQRPPTRVLNRRPVRSITSYDAKRILIHRHSGDGEALPLHWTSCHPATIARFKAEMTCANGHGLTLRSHAIDAMGVVSPSVVCPIQGCSFHEFVELDGWNFGSLPKRGISGLDATKRGD